MNHGTRTFSRTSDPRRPLAVGQRWRNLQISTEFNGAPSLYLRIQVDEVLLTDDQGRCRLLRSPHLLPRIDQPYPADDLDGESLRIVPRIAYTGGAGLQGDGGIDTGGVPAIGWYYIWLMCDESGLKVRAFLSLSATSPKLRPGMVFKARLGAAYLFSAGYFFPFWQVDDFVALGDYAIDNANLVFASSITGVTAWTELTGTPLARFQKLVPPPPVCKSVSLRAFSTVLGSHLGMALSPQVSGATVLGERKIKVTQAGLVLGAYAHQPCELSLVDYKFFYKMDGVTAVAYNVRVEGWRL